MSDRDPVAGTWAGLPVFTCPVCGRDAFDEGEIRAHLAAMHPAPPEETAYPEPDPAPDPAPDPEPDPAPDPVPDATAREGDVTTPAEWSGKEF